MSTLFISAINTKITEEYLRTQRENQYFERKGLGKKDAKPTKIAEELIGMLNADGGVLTFGVSDTGEYESMEKSMLSVPEYKEANGNVCLTLRNKISEHSKTIDDKVMEKIEANFGVYNDTQKRILNYLFEKQTATVGDLSHYTRVNQNTVRDYLNGFIEDGIIIRNSNKLRDKNALYCFKKD